MKNVCCRSESREELQVGSPPPRARVARALVGAAVIAGAGLLYVWPLALLQRAGLPEAAAWTLAAPSLWLGTSHVVAAVTGYRGCPELGAIASVLTARDLPTRCRPWEWVDRRVTARAR